MRPIRLIMTIACTILVTTLACEDSAAPDDAPEGHTVIKDGVAHATGLDNPTVNCTACHGADLRGGDNGEPSCFTCHGQLWP
jgi:hypothetical protein